MEIAEFPKSETFNRKVKWNENFQEKFFQNLGIPHEVGLFFGIYAKFSISNSALVSSFSHDHSELDISCKDDEHSRKETL